MASEEVIQDGASYLWGGMDSYTMPMQVGGNEYVAGMNTVCRGGLVKTRPGSRTMFCLPEGNIQGGAFFNPTNGEPHIVVAVDGYIYVSPAPFSEYRLLTNVRFGATSEYVSFTECLQSTFYDDLGVLQFYDTPFSVLVMQDSNTRAAYWDGSTSQHLDPTPANRPDGLTEAGKDGTRIGLWSVWSNNRLWVSFNNVLYASDIGNPLKFTESQYLNEGRAFYLPGTCTGLVELPDQSGIIAFTENNGTFFQSSIQDRTQWLQTPDFQKLILPKVGCVAPLSITTQYGLIWWFSPKGVISLDGAFRQNLSSRLSIQDNEMLASKYGIGPKLNGICGAYFENYLLMSVPSYDGLNAHTWVLDQAVFEQEAKAWAGYWKGWRPVQWFRGSVNGDERIFFVSKDYDGGNRVWEAFLSESKDNGTSILCFLQTKEHSFGGGYDLKKFRNAQLFIREMLGNVDLAVNVAGQRGGWQRIFTKGFVATEGQVYHDEEYEVGENLFAGNRPQTRVVQSEVLGAPNESQVCEIESDIPIGVDRAFSLWFIWQGVMGIEAYRLFALTQQENLDGECRPDESGVKSLEFCGDSAAAKFVDFEESGTSALGSFSAAFTQSYVAADGSIVTATRDGGSVISQNAANRTAQEYAEVAAAEEASAAPFTSCRSISGSAALRCFSMQSRSCSGSTVLCGFPENAGHVSSPPIAYRRRERSGSFRFRRTGGIPSGTHSPPCPGTVINQLFYTLARVDMFVVGACSSTVLSSSATLTNELTGATIPGDANNIPNHPYPDLTTTIAATTRTFTGSNLCTRRFIPGQVFDTGTEEQVETLSIADTYEAAIARHTGGSCASVSPLLSVIGPFQPTGITRNLSNFNFSYADAAEARVYLTGLEIGEGYSTILEVERRPIGGGEGDWDFWQNLTISHTASAVDEFTDWAVLPSASGFETRVTSACLNESAEDIVAGIVANATFGGIAGCSLATSFISESSEDGFFTYRAAQVSFSASNLVIGRSYMGTITFGRRVLGSTGLYSVVGSVVVSFVAGSAFEVSDWIDVPYVQGFETAAIGISVV